MVLKDQGWRVIGKFGSLKNHDLEHAKGADMFLDESDNIEDESFIKIEIEAVGKEQQPSFVFKVYPDEPCTMVIPFLLNEIPNSNAEMEDVILYSTEGRIIGNSSSFLDLTNKLLFFSFLNEEKKFFDKEYPNEDVFLKILSQYPYSRSLFVGKLIKKEKLFHSLKNPHLWKIFIRYIGLKEEDGEFFIEDLRMLWKL